MGLTTRTNFSINIASWLCKCYWN